MKVIVKGEEELVQLAQELIKVVVNLRHATKVWEENYGVENKKSKKCWEERADKLISKLQVPDLNRNEQIKIEINEDIT